MKNTILIIILQFIFGFSMFPQSSEESFVPAEFKGGMTKLIAYVNQQTRYPKQAKDNCIGGVIYVNFTIDSLGNVNNLTLSNNIGYGCDEEAKRVIKSTSGKWIPAINDSKPINSTYGMPVKFKKNQGCIPFYFKFIETGDKFFTNAKYSKAISQYDKILEIKPFNAHSLLKRGLSKLETGDTIGACNDWNKIPNYEKDKAKGYISKYCKE